MLDEQIYQFSHNPSDGVDELLPNFYEVHPDGAGPMVGPDGLPLWEEGGEG